MRTSKATVSSSDGQSKDCTTVSTSVYQAINTLKRHRDLLRPIVAALRATLAGITGADSAWQRGDPDRVECLCATGNETVQRHAWQR